MPRKRFGVSLKADQHSRVLSDEDWQIAFVLVPGAEELVTISPVIWEVYDCAFGAVQPLNCEMSLAVSTVKNEVDGLVVPTLNHRIKPGQYITLKSTHRRPPEWSETDQSQESSTSSITIINDSGAQQKVAVSIARYDKYAHGPRYAPLVTFPLIGNGDRLHVSTKFHIQAYVGQGLREMQELDRSSARRVLDEKSEKMWSVAVDDLPVVSRFVVSQQVGGQATLMVEDLRESLGAQAGLDTNEFQRKLRTLEEHANNVKRALGDDYLGIQRLKSEIQKSINNMVPQRKPSLGDEHDVHVEKALVEQISATVVQTLREERKEMRYPIYEMRPFNSGDNTGTIESTQPRQSYTYVSGSRTSPPRTPGMSPIVSMVAPSSGTPADSAPVPAFHSWSSSIHAAAAEVEARDSLGHPRSRVTSNADIDPLLPGPNSLSDTTPSLPISAPVDRILPPHSTSLHGGPQAMSGPSSLEDAERAGAVRVADEARSLVLQQPSAEGPTTGVSVLAADPTTELSASSKQSKESSLGRRSRKRQNSTPIGDNPEESGGFPIIGALFRPLKPTKPKPIKRTSGDNKVPSSKHSSSSTTATMPSEPVAENTPAATALRPLSPIPLDHEA